MSKASELNDARLQGMNYALKQIKANGIEAFEAEMKWRAGIRIGVNIKPQELNEAAHKIREKLDATMRAMALIVLHDEFDFGRKRLDRFVARWNKKAEGIMENYATWDDYIAVVEEIMGEKFEVEYK